MTKIYDIVVFIGRLQPSHKSHIGVVKKALEIGHKVILVIGSHGAARSLRNPFTTAERKEMILSCFSENERARIETVGVRDYYSDLFWANDVRQKVSQFSKSGDRIALIGSEKDFTTYYLSLFPEWDSVGCEIKDSQNSTAFRNSYFAGQSDLTIEGHFPAQVLEWLKAFKSSQGYLYLRQEFEAIAKYKKSWEGAPYPPIFSTVDAVVIACGHVLLIRRGDFPGKGLLALPGGFLEATERIKSGVIRELIEETTIGVSKEELIRSIKKVECFDHPLRSDRGRTITHAHLINLDVKSLPSIKASDDAKEALWVPILDVPKLESEFFEDHMHIISFFTRSY